MPTPKKKKKQKRAVKNNLRYNPKTQFPDGTGLLEKDVKDYLKKNPPSNVDISDAGSGVLNPEFVTPDNPMGLATGAITPDNNLAQLAMPWGKALQGIHRWGKSLSQGTFDLIKKKAKEGLLSYGMFAEILERSAESSFDKHMSSKNEEEKRRKAEDKYNEKTPLNPIKFYKGGIVKPIKRKR